MPTTAAATHLRVGQEKQRPQLSKKRVFADEENGRLSTPQTVLLSAQIPFGGYENNEQIAHQNEEKTAHQKNETAHQKNSRVAHQKSDETAHQKNSEIAYQKTDKLLTKKKKLRDGWIEWRKRGTKNKKRYAYRRRRVWKSDELILATPKRIRSIRPLSEGNYERLKAKQKRQRKRNSRTSVRKSKAGT